MGSTIKIRPFQFVHVLDLNSNITRIENGPQTLILMTNEKLLAGPLPQIVIPPGHYCIIRHPCSEYVSGKVCKLKHGHLEVKFHGEPFVLYPGEILDGDEDFKKSGSYKKAVKPLPVVAVHHAILLEARLDHYDEVEGVERKAGDIWQQEGPLTYIPTPYTDMKGFKKPQLIKKGQSLRMKAVQAFVDKDGRERVTGEEWLIDVPGAYLPGVFEEMLGLEEAITLTRDLAIHLRASQNTTDSLRIKRNAGDEWLVTVDDTESLTPRIGVEVIQRVKKTVLRTNQYCIVLNPVNKHGKPQLGKREVRRGITSFFLHPGEMLEKGIQEAHIIGANEALVLQAEDEFLDTISDDEEVRREPGERWMVLGPLAYVPTIHVTIVDRRKEIPLAENEGVYVRNIKSGDVRAVMGPQSYLLTEEEMFFKKDLPEQVELMLKNGGGLGSGDIRKISYFEQSIDPKILKGRDKKDVVTYRCPHNTACQVYNHAQKTARVIFGPDLVVLGPHENFNVLSLSAGKPKVEGALKSLALMLGPDFITDIITVETSDHARLRVKLAFNNYFEFDQSNQEQAAKLFSVPDFIGNACRQVGSKIRGAVAQVKFDEFHRNSASVIQHAVFGKDKDGKPLSQLKFDANNLVITNVDIQSIEPVDTKMRDSLMKSIQLAIEIATSSVEATAAQDAKCVEQMADGELERQKLVNEKAAEKERTKLFMLRAVTAAVESTGQAVAEAQAHAQKVNIECLMEIENARLKAEAAEIEHAAQLETQNKLRQAELEYQKIQNALELDKHRQLSSIEVNKFARTVGAIGAETLAAIANAGPEMQVRMLESLGLESTLFTDGSSPVNLFSTAKGLVAEAE